MAVVIGGPTTVWTPFNWTLLFARQPEPDLEFTEEELEQTITTKPRGPITPRKKPSGGSPLLWVLLLILVGGIAYVSMEEPELMTELLSPYLGETSPPPPPMPVKPVPRATTPPAPLAVAPQPPPSTGNGASAPVVPTAPPPAVTPAAPAVVSPPQMAATPPAPAAPSHDPMFSEGQKVTITVDDAVPGGNILLYADASSGKPGPTVHPGVSLTIMDGDLQPSGWMYFVRSDEGAKGWVSEKRLRLKF